MVYFCADDYGISKESNRHIEECLRDGVLNKISVLANGDLGAFKQDLQEAQLSLHINLLEGRALSDPKDIPLLVSDEGYFKCSFGQLLLMSLFGKRKQLQRQLYKELRAQLLFWKDQMGQAPLSVDSHQHTHMIPLIFKTLLQVIKEEDLAVTSLRIPAEPLAPYLLSPSLYFSYTPIGLVKQWVLKCFFVLNYGELKRSKIPYAYFMGVLFSGHMTEQRIRKLLPLYRKLGEKRGRDIELGLHPGYLEPGGTLIQGARTSFEKFYFSTGRKMEYDTLMNLKF